MIIVREDWATLVRLMAIAHHHRPLTDNEIEFALWERTCFPFGTVQQVIPQLHDYFESAAP